MKPAKDNTFCYYPFSQLTLKDWDEYGIWKTAPCCNSIRPESPDPLQIQPTLRPDNYAPPTQQQIDNAFPEKLFHGPEMTELRESMLRGEKHSACTTCWKMEDRDPENPTSYRLQSHPPALDEFNIDDPQLQCIDFGFGENCNLRCRMCGPGLSNKLRTDYKYFVDNQIDTTGVYQFDWQDAFKKLDQDMIENNIKTPHAPETAITHLRPKSESAVYAWPTEEYDSQWRDILANIHNLRQIKATGGETTVSKPFLEFIDTAIEKDAAKNILLEFHTNSTKFTDKFVDKLMKFKRLHINNSIDSLGKNYEYIRYPMKWDIVDKSMQKLHNSKREDSTLIIGNWSFNVVLSALNAHSIKDLSEYFIDTYVRKGNAEGYTLYLDNLWPEHKFINVQYLPRSIKSDLLNEYKELDNLHKRANIVTSKGRHSNYHIQLNSGIQWLQQTMDIEITDAHRESMRREIKVFDLSRKQDYHDYLHPDVIEYIDNPYKGN
jgi:MoaA/NifB/PqqE/SkfB family radical SAM enzyme